MGQYEKHVFICTNGPFCPYDGDTEALLKRLKQRVGNAGLKDQIRINRAGCLNQCGHGPNMVVYPENIWYAGVQESDADDIFDTHLAGGTPVARLLYHAPPGDNKETGGYPPEVYEAERRDKLAQKERERGQAEVRGARKAGEGPHVQT